MENNLCRETQGRGLPKVPSLVQHISNVKKSSSFEESEKKGQGDEQEHSVSINMPSNCEEVRLHDAVRVPYSGETDLNSNGAPIFSSESITTYSKPRMPSQSMPNHENIKRLNDRRTKFFKTWYGKLEAKLSILHGRVHTQSVEDDSNLSNTENPLPVDLFVKALEDPHVQTPKKSSEEMVHPQDKQWPFLLRFPISSFGICLGVSSQAILWKALATSPSTEFLHITPKINFVLWLISVAVVATIFSIYLFKIILYFEAVRREYHHAVRVNFFFAPWISLLFLALGVPSSIAKELHHAVWYILMIPLFFLMLKIYGQWMFGGKRKLSKVANPTNMLAIVGNFVGALLGASMGLREGPIFFLTLGLAHYMVIFVTLSQMLPTNKTIPRDLHPVFFLLVAPPSVASLALAKIQGSFHLESRIFYFTSMFLYLTLAVRVNLFRGLKFSISWWAYTFPMTAAAIATINYTNQVTNVGTQALSVILSLISTFVVTTVFVSTIVHAFVLRDLFPNDLAIATSERKRKTHKKRFPLGFGSHGHAKKTENYLKFVNSDKNDLV